MPVTVFLGTGAKRSVATGWVNSYSNMGREVGRVYDVNHLVALRRYLDRNNVDLVLNSTQTKFTARAVGRHELHQRSNPTYYEVYHELQHYRHLKGVGYSTFSRTSEPRREQYVYDQLRLSRVLWDNIFNQAERDNAFLYLLHKGGNPMSMPAKDVPFPDLP